jgi:hypothetical protein
MSGESFVPLPRRLGAHIRSGDLDEPRLALLCFLALEANYVTARVSIPSLRWLKDSYGARCDTKTLSRHLLRLEQAGLISILERPLERQRRPYVVEITGGWRRDCESSAPATATNDPPLVSQSTATGSVTAPLHRHAAKADGAPTSSSSPLRHPLRCLPAPKEVE